MVRKITLSFLLLTLYLYSAVATAQNYNFQEVTFPALVNMQGKYNVVPLPTSHIHVHVLDRGYYRFMSDPAGNIYLPMELHLENGRIHAVAFGPDAKGNYLLCGHSQEYYNVLTPKMKLRYKPVLTCITILSQLDLSPAFRKDYAGKD